VTPLSVGNTSQVAYVLGVTSNSGVFAILSPTNTPDQSLFSLTLTSNSWSALSISTNSSHRGLGTVSVMSRVNSTPSTVRLLDAGGVEEIGSVSTQGLVAYYPFNGNANDQSANGNNGTVNGATLAMNRFGVPNQAYYFNGNAGITIPDSPSLEVNGSAVTLAAWVNPMGQGVYTIFRKHEQSGGSGGCYMRLLSGNLDFGAVFSSGYREVTSPYGAPSLNTWSHVAVVYDGQTIWFYVNGVLVYSVSQTGSLLADSTVAAIGSLPNADYFVGDIDEVRVYNRALGPQEVLGLATSGFSPVVISEVSATRTNNWRGYSLAYGFPRQTNAASIFYTFVDDLNEDGQVDAGDNFVMGEFLVNGSTYQTNTLLRVPITQSNGVAQSYGLACANILNTSNQVFFTGEPNGSVYSWVTNNNTAPLQRQLFDGHYRGKGWQQLAAYNGLSPGQGLVGLMVDPASPNACQLIYWGPQQSLPALPNVPETPPTTVIMPTPNSGGTLSTVNITITKAEGNNCYPVLQYQDPVSSNWLNATIQTIDGVAYSPTLAVTAMPTGTLHTLVWNALANLGAPYTNNLSLQARSSDFMLTGPWSPSVSYSVSIPADTVGDGIPNLWRQQYFGGSGTNTNSVSCATCDPDGDGMNNLQEYLTGTIPTNSASYFHITSVLQTNNSFLVSWMTGIGRTNALQVGTGTGGSYATNFTDIFTVTNTTSTVTNFLDLGGATNKPSRYYRVRLAP